MSAAVRIAGTYVLAGLPMDDSNHLIVSLDDGPPIEVTYWQIGDSVPFTLIHDDTGLELTGAAGLPLTCSYHPVGGANITERVNKLFIHALPPTAAAPEA